MLDNLRHIKRMLMPGFAMLATVLTGCIDDASLCPAAGAEGEEDVTFEFTVVTRDLSGHGTRALQTAGLTLQEGTLVENYLDLDNTVFMLFDETKTLIKVFVPYVDPDRTTYATYSVRAFMSPQEFHTLTDGKTNVTFHIAVAGNYSRLNPQNANYFVGKKLDDIFSQTATFAMPVSNNWSNVWIPSIYGTAYTDAAGQEITGMTPAQIPMAGIQTYTIPVASLAAGTVDKPYALSDGTGNGDINMLRAIAKIEVVDRIDAVGTGAATVQPDRDGRTWIEKVELVGHTTRGSLFPTLAQWNLTGSPYETQYVRAASIPGTSTYSGAEMTESVNESNLINFFADATATAEREDKCRVFTCYLTEYNPTAVAANERMWLRVTAHTPGSDSADENSTFYNLRVGDYQNGTVSTTMPILRNNIYRYEVTGLQGDLNLTLTVDDWNSAPVQWEYTDNPGVTDPIQWNAAAEVNRNLATVMCPYGQEIYATFTLATPLDGEWTAQILPLNANTAADAFVFVDGEGKEVETVSGTVDGAPSTIRVKAKYQAFEFNREAMLVITVKNPVDGRIITADVLNGEYGRNTYFTIIQNASL